MSSLFDQYVRRTSQNITKVTTKAKSGVKKVETFGRNCVKGLEKMASGAIKALFTKPSSVDDYIKIGQMYISKRAAAITTAIVLSVSLLIYYVLWPYANGRLWAAKLVVNTPEYHAFTGKGNVTYTKGGNLLYKGEMVNGKSEGAGELYDEGTLVYEGQFSDNKYDGEGKLYENETLIYEGVFSDNVYNGEGKLYENGVLLYSGSFQEGVYSGTGTLYKDGETLYSGGFLAGEYDGRGTVFKDGRPLYAGEFESGVYDGEGTLYGENGRIFTGEFSDGKYLNGTEYYESGRKKYSGAYEAGEYTGEGRLYADDASNSLVYEGELVKSAYNGRGKLYENGSLLYDGEFVNNVYNGEGRLNYIGGGTEYEGGFSDGVFNGFGKKYEKTTGRLIYEGTFEKGVYAGSGKLYNTEINRIQYDGGFLDGIFNGQGNLFNNAGAQIFTGSFYMGQIDYESFANKAIDDIRESFGKENTVVDNENSFLLIYNDLSVCFEFRYVTDETQPPVAAIKLLGDQIVRGVYNLMSIAELKELFADNEAFTEYEMELNEEDIAMFDRLGMMPPSVGYCIKYNFESTYLRAYSTSVNGDVCYFEIGAL